MNADLIGSRKILNLERENPTTNPEASVAWIKVEFFLVT
jgi:hypothetical protein